MATRRLPLLFTVAIIGSRPSPAHAEDLDAADPSEVTQAPSKTYQYDHEYFSIRFGGGLLNDYNHVEQDEDSEQQLPALHSEIGIRDLRVLVSGRTPWKPLIYTTGYMYDAKKNEWVFRQTGLKLTVEGLHGFFFFGRTKEGFSTNKLMVGYYGWFNERSAANDAFLPILADGIRWTGASPGGGLVYNLGAFADPLSDKQTFNKNDWQVAARAVWLPLGTDTLDGVLHLAAEGRVAGANDGMLQYRSKAEGFLLQSNAVDTGEFEATNSLMAGLEAYYVRGPLSIGSEYYVNQVMSSPASDPFFHGGDVFLAYLLTGETHPYKGPAGVFEDVQPRSTFFSGGPGAWELAARLSHVDLDSGPIEGGMLTKVTALVNWYLNDTLRFELAYGYGVLDRFDNTGGTHVIQTRVQLQIK
jgi:phosphate-selective porin OprO and OprP